MTGEQRTAYLHSAEPNLCPYCKGDDVQGGFVEIDGKQASQNVLCVDCHAEWRDVYVLSTVVEITPPAKRKMGK